MAMIGLDLVVKTIIISASGALAPGPLTSAVAAWGARRGWGAGLRASLGHMLVEVPLVTIIALGISNILANPELQRWIALFGGIFLLLFGYMTIRDGLRGGSLNEPVGRLGASPFMIGVSLSLFNPFFVVWWIGTGAPLIMQAYDSGGYLGVFLMYIAHVWLDYAWLSVVAHVASLGGRHERIYRLLLLILGAMIFYFGIEFITLAIA